MTATCGILLPALARLAGRELSTADCHLLDSSTNTKLSFHIATPLVLATPEARLEFKAWVAEHIDPVGAPLIDCGVYGAARNMRLSFCTKTGSSARLVPTERVGALRFAACAPRVGEITPAVLVDHLWTAILPYDARNVVSAETISAQRAVPFETERTAQRTAQRVAPTGPALQAKDGTSLTEAQFYDLHGCTFEQYVAAATSALQSAGVPRLPEADGASAVRRVGDGRLYWFTSNRHTCCHGNVHAEDNFTTRLVQGAVQRACYADECRTKNTPRPLLDWRTICYVAKDSSSGLQPAFRREFGPGLTALGFVLSSVSDVEPTGPVASRFAYSAPCAMCPDRCVHTGVFYASIAADGLVTVHAPRSACSSPPVCAVAGSRKTRFPPTDFALYRPLFEAVLGVPTLSVVESAVCRLVNWKVRGWLRPPDPPPRSLRLHRRAWCCRGCDGCQSVHQ